MDSLMAIQTVFYDSDGWVKCVEDGDSKAVVHGCERAISDPSVHGELTTDHKVTVKDGEVTDATYLPQPSKWHSWSGSEWVEDTQQRLDDTLSESLQAIDSAAQNARSRYARTLSLQGGTYEQKRLEVLDWEAGVSRSYPYIEEEAKERGETEQQVKDRIRANIDKWLDVDRLNPIIDAKAEVGMDRCKEAHSNGDLAGIETVRDDTVSALDTI